MSVIRAQFDGKVFVPQEPVSLPEGTKVQILVEPVTSAAKQQASEKLVQSPFSGLLERLDKIEDESELPVDASMHVDHYLYGHSKSAD